MKTQSALLAALASAPVALAHTVFSDIYVNGVPQGDGVAMRMSNDSPHSMYPIKSLGSDDMACNVGGTKGVSRVQSVPDGATLTFEIRASPRDPSEGRLDRGHKGPCAVYLKKVTSAIKDKGAGDGWFKIFEHGYDSSSDSWCSEKVIDNNGLLNVKLPAGLEGGYYLARPELLALHRAKVGDPQFYTSCAQIFLKSDGSLVPESTVSIPGHVDYGQPSTSFDIYSNDKSTYELPGPKLAKLTAKSAHTGKSGQPTQTEGQKPAGCLVENANWCGVEVDDYSDKNGCWASGKQCWQQAEKCFDTAPCTGNAGCRLWQAKCQDIDDACTAGRFKGPPNKNKVLMQEKKKINVGAVLSGGIGSSNVDTTPKKASAAATKVTNAVPVGQKPESGADTEAPKATPTQGAPSYDAAPAPAPAPEAPSSEEGADCADITEVETVVEYVTAANRAAEHVVRRRRARR